MPVGSRGLIALAALAGCLEAPPGTGAPRSDASQVPRAWVDRTGASPPAALWGPRLAYDSLSGRVLAYGGSPSADTAQAVSTFMYWDGVAWFTICDPCAPGPRLAHGFTFDSVRGRAVLYGGLDEGGVRQADLWEWDGSEWTEVAAAADGGLPGPRSNFWMAHDPGRGRVVLFGGETDTGLSNEVFEYDGDTWRASGQPPGPDPRSDDGAAAAYDPISGRVLVYGRKEPNGDDLWAWDGEGWTRLCAGCTGVQRHAAMLEVDPARERILIVGGFNDTEVQGTWELLPDGSPACSWGQPGARDTSGIARDASRDVIVLYGGNGSACGGYCDQTLELVFDEGGTCAP